MFILLFSIFCNFFLIVNLTSGSPVKCKNKYNKFNLVIKNKETNRTKQNLVRKNNRPKRSNTHNGKTNKQHTLKTTYVVL